MDDGLVKFKTISERDLGEAGRGKFSIAERRILIVLASAIAAPFIFFAGIMKSEKGRTLSSPFLF